MVFVARRAGAWVMGGGRTLLRGAAGWELAVDEVCSSGFRGRRFVRWVTDCGSWAGGDIGAGGGVAAGVLRVRSGGEEEMTINPLKDASIGGKAGECFVPGGAAVAL